MTRQVKTVWYPLGVRTLANDSATYTVTLDSVTIAWPEQSASLIEAFMVVQATAVGLQSAPMRNVAPRARIGSGNFFQGAQVGANVAPGRWSHRDVGPMRINDAFSLGWSTTMTLSLEFVFTSLVNGAGNFFGALALTVAYDDSSTYQTKTVLVPLRRDAGVISGIGTAEVTVAILPALTGVSGLLPETSASVRALAVVYDAPSNIGAQDPLQPHLRLGTNPTLSYTLIRSDAYSFAAQQLIYQGPALNYQNQQVFFAGLGPVSLANVTAERFPRGIAWAMVTYEYNAQATSRVYCEALLHRSTRQLGTATTSGVPLSRSLSSTASLVNSLRIPEQNPTLIRSMTRLLGGNGLPAPVRNNQIGMRVGALPYVSASFSVISTANQGVPLFFDFENSAGGTVASLSYGWNAIETRVRNTDLSFTAPFYLVEGWTRLAWIADKPLAWGSHSRVVTYPFGSMWETTATMEQVVTGANFDLGNTNYHLHAAILELGGYYNTASQDQWTFVRALYDPGAREDGVTTDALAAPSFRQYSDVLGGHFVSSFDLLGLARRTRHEPVLKTRLDESRNWVVGMQALVAGENATFFPYLRCSVHNVVHFANRTLTGASGTGDAITVETYSRRTGQKVGEVSTSASGLYRVAYNYRDEALFDRAQQDATRVGSSAEYSI